MDASQGNVAEFTPPGVAVPPAGGDKTQPPVRQIRPDELRQLGQNLTKLFDQYRSDRRLAEQKWLRSLRQYLGIYDPEIEKSLSADRSKAYPKITRIKVISTLARIMNLMFPGNERNWDLKASPNAEMAPPDVMEAVQKFMKKSQEQGVATRLDVQAAVQQLADERAEGLLTVIDDQLQELGGDQTLDYVSLSRKVALSGVLYGLGVLQGPFVRQVQRTKWEMTKVTDIRTGQPVDYPQAVVQTLYKPQFEFLPVWDFYPDMSAKTLASMDGYFVRKVMTRSQLRDLANRPDFFGEIIKTYLRDFTQGNYKALEFETDLRSMGVTNNVTVQKADSSKYEILIWNGPISGQHLQNAGVDIRPELVADDIEAEVWMVDGYVIKAAMNPWRQMGVDLKTIHTFVFDEDDTSPVGNGLPAVMRDSQMSVSAAARMLLDNASVVCGPNMELNLDLMRSDQDLTSFSAYKIWYREGTGPEATYPAVRPVMFDAHMKDLMEIIKLFMEFADAETFVGPATGGDMAKTPSEPMRTAAGASMLRGDAALPFKDIVRQFDFFTQSLITSMVAFNRKLNPDAAPEGDYNVIARGATSLIAKEVRGIQLDTLAVSLTPEEKDHVDERKLVEARLKVRDCGDLLLPPSEVERKQVARSQQMSEMEDLQKKTLEAEVRKTLAEAYKSITQGQKNSAAADANTANTALAILEQALGDVEQKASDKPASGKSQKSTGSGTSR